MPAETDIRSASQCVKQWEKIEQIKRALVRQALLNGDATPAMVIAKIREVIPADLFQS